MNKKRLILLFMLLAFPVSAMAQTATSTNRFYQDGLRESGRSYQYRIQEYLENSSELRQKISALSGTAVTSVLMPILFGVGINDISPNFGAPRSGGRTHEGEDMLAVKGTPIVSPTPAVVIRTGVEEDAGNYVYTANPGGEIFVYIHLDRIGEGVVSGLVLQKGSLIGYVGNTGNASGGQAHLHFEIHSSSDIPVDPFPRLTGEFALQEKISYLSVILSQSSDPASLSQLLVSNFRKTFLDALAANVTLPLPIINALATVQSNVPTDDLDIGSSGPLVVELQKYLIQAASGNSTKLLANAGATGYFGPITQAALREYQKKVGISPSTGYYGPTTRAFIAAHPFNGGSISGLTRDLEKNMSGEDVRALQKLLNAFGFTVATTGSGSPGEETTLFGPATKAAVIRFQVARGITPAAGYVGPITRSALATEDTE